METTKCNSTLSGVADACTWESVLSELYRELPYYKDHAVNGDSLLEGLDIDVDCDITVECEFEYITLEFANCEHRPGYIGDDDITVTEEYEIIGPDVIITRNPDGTITAIPVG